MKAKKCGKRYRITYRHPDIQTTIHESFDTEEAANLRIAQIQLDKKLGTFTPPKQYIDASSPANLIRETMTVAQLLEEYIQLHALHHWSVGTLQENQQRIDDYIVPYIGEQKIKDLTTHGLESFYQMLLTVPAVKLKGRESEDRTVSPYVVTKCHTILRSALNQALRWDYLRGNNPAMAVELPKSKRGKRDAWTDQEAKRALACCQSPRLLLCMYLALGCSMRIGEILGLTWSCVHIEDELTGSDDAFLVVDKELRRCDKASMERLRKSGNDDVFYEFPNCTQRDTRTVLVLKTPKTESSVRKIYLPVTVIVALKEEKRRQETLKRDLGDEYQDFDLVVAQANGRPVEERFIAKEFAEFIEANGLKKVVFHSLRHSSTSLKLKYSGGDIKAVQGDTGHAQANMVTDVYSHIMNEDRKRLARKMDSEFFQSSVESQETESAASAAWTSAVPYSGRGSSASLLPYRRTGSDPVPA